MRMPSISFVLITRMTHRSQDESVALTFDDTAGSSSTIATTGSTVLARPSGKSAKGRLGDNKAAGLKEIERKLAEVELDRTLCMNRIAQVRASILSRVETITNVVCRSTDLRPLCTLSHSWRKNLTLSRNRKLMQ